MAAIKEGYLYDPVAKKLRKATDEEYVRQEILVLKSQQWMNDTYGGDSRYTRVAEDGATGWGTINGLIIALQIELGMAETAAVIGPTTRGKFNAKYPGGITRQAADDTDTDNVHA